MKNYTVSGGIPFGNSRLVKSIIATAPDDRHVITGTLILALAVKSTDNERKSSSL